MKFIIEIRAEIEPEVSEEEFIAACDNLSRGGVYGMDGISSEDIQKIITENKTVTGNYAGVYKRALALADVVDALVEVGAIDLHQIEDDEMCIDAVDTELSC